MVPDGPWYCHLCDTGFSNPDEFRRDEDPILFARRNDPYFPEHEQLLSAYVRRQEAGLLQYRQTLSADADYSVPEASRWAFVSAEEVFSENTPKSLKRKIRSKAKNLRLHPTLDGWYIVRTQLRTGDRLWLAVPPVAYRWALIGAHHDRMGHAGVTQTLAVVHQHHHWPGI